MKTLNAIIKTVDITNEDYCLMMNIELQLEGGSGVCFGGISLGKPSGTVEQYKKSCPWNIAGYYITRVLKVVGVFSVNALVGQPCRAIFKNDASLGDIIIGIQNFLSEEKFIPREDFKGE